MNLTLIEKYNLSLYTDDAELIKVLSTDKDYYVRCYVARNPNTPVEVLKVLSIDGSWAVRRFVARNTNATNDVILLVKAYNMFNT